MALTNLRADCVCAKPAPYELHAIRAAHVERVNAAADKRRTLDPMAGMPHTLTAAGCYLAAHGVTDEPCNGERFFRVDFAHYAALAAGCPEIVETGRRALFVGRRAIVPQVPATVVQIASATERMVATQMTAYPAHWSDADKRDLAEHHLFTRHAGNGCLMAREG